VSTTEASSPHVEPELGGDFLARPEFAEVSREVRPAPPRYRNEIGKFSIRRSSDCINCGRCIEACKYDVHVRPEGYRSILRPFDYRCVGPDCAEKGKCCMDACPQGALSITENPAFKTLGDYRWTPDLLVGNWSMAETGNQPPSHLECEVGASGGGFDRLRFLFPASAPADLRREDISTKLLLNRRDDSRPKIAIEVPWYGGGM
jgi:ferredoxin